MSEILNDHSAKLNFKVVFRALPGVEFYCTSFGIPSVALENPQVTVPRGRWNEHGTRLEFGNIATIVFIIDKEFSNYAAAYQWMRNMAPIDAGDKYKYDGRATCSAVILDNGLPIREFVFYDVLPKELGSVDLTNMDEVVTSIECTFVFNFSYFDVKSV